MRFTAVGFAAVFTTLALGAAGCAGNAPPTRPAVDQARAAACPTFTERVYFDIESETMPEAGRPVIEAIARRIEECRAVGGTLTAVRVVAFPDTSESGPEADQRARLRADKVREALVVAGVPRARIETLDYTAITERDNRILRRHATIGVVLN